MNENFDSITEEEPERGTESEQNRGIETSPTHFDISMLNVESIENGELETLVPEFYQLKNVVENNSWHNRETVFDHTLSVLRELEQVLDLITNENVQKILALKIDNLTRKSLLKIATLFHDIAKPETLVAKEDGTTSCPDHEKIGSEKVVKILNRLQLSQDETDHIKILIENHGLLHGILPPNGTDFEDRYSEFKERFFENIYPELMLLAYADTIGSYQKETKPDEYQSRIKFYETELNNFQG